MSNKKIQEITKKALPILKSYDVTDASIFGSYVRGEENSDSDIDMLVTFKGNKSLLDLVSLMYALENKIGKKFDISTYKAIHPAVKNQILKEQIKIL